MFVIIEFIGTFRSLMGTKKCNLELEEKATISTLVHRLKAVFSIGEEFDEANMFILVNEKEMSTLNGLKTELRSNDIITMVSVTHGG
jgi:molybdopterin converting factor small subunit